MLANPSRIVYTVKRSESASDKTFRAVVAAGLVPQLGSGPAGPQLIALGLLRSVLQPAAQEDRPAPGCRRRLDHARLEPKLAEVRTREDKVERADRESQALREELSRSVADQRRELERVGRMTTQEAKDALTGQIVGEAKRDAMATVREIEQRAREEGEKRARNIVTIAIQ